MSQLELEQELFEEGMMVSGIIKNFSPKEIYDLSPTKLALFYALYQGPVHSIIKESTK